MGLSRPLVVTEGTAGSTGLFLLLFADVAAIVEVAEEDDEGDAVTKHKCVHGIGEVTVCEKVVTRVQQEHHKLHLEGKGSLQIILRKNTHTHTPLVQTGSAHQLQGCEVFFPPQILLHVRPDGSQAVVGIHDDMDEGVQEANEERCRRCTHIRNEAICITPAIMIAFRIDGFRFITVVTWVCSATRVNRASVPTAP